MPPTNTEIANTIAQQMQSYLAGLDLNTQRIIDILTILRDRIITRIAQLQDALDDVPPIAVRDPVQIQALIEANEQNELLTSPLADHVTDPQRWHQQQALHIETNSYRWTIGWPQRQHFGLD